MLIHVFNFNGSSKIAFSYCPNNVKHAMFVFRFTYFMTKVMLISEKTAITFL